MGMTGSFKNLLNLRMQRSVKQAVGFYCACLVMFFLVAFVGGAVYGVLYLPRTTDFNYAFEAVAEDATLRMLLLAFNTVMSFLIMALLVWKKGLQKNIIYLLLVPVTAIAAYMLGVLFALIPAAYITTYAPKRVGGMHV